MKLDDATKNAGATLTFAAPGNSYKLDIGNAALGVSDVNLSPIGPGAYRADLGGGGSVSVTIHPNSLSWMTYGTWEVAMTNGTSQTATL